jgi:hypothetical protein
VLGERRHRREVAETEMSGATLPNGASRPPQETFPMRGILLWLVGIPIPIILLLWLFGVLG